MFESTWSRVLFLVLLLVVIGMLMRLASCRFRSEEPFQSLESAFADRAQSINPAAATLRSYPIDAGTRHPDDPLDEESRVQLLTILERIQTGANLHAERYEPFNSIAIPVSTELVEYDTIRPFVEYLEEMFKHTGPRYEFLVKDTLSRVKRSTDLESYITFVVLIDFERKDAGRLFTNVPLEVAVHVRGGSHTIDQLRIAGSSTYLPGIDPPDLQMLRPIDQLVDIDPFLLQNAIEQKKQEHQAEMDGLTNDIPTYGPEARAGRTAGAGLGPADLLRGTAGSTEVPQGLDYNQILRQQREIDMVSDRNILQFQKQKELF